MPENRIFPVYTPQAETAEEDCERRLRNREDHWTETEKLRYSAGYTTATRRWKLEMEEALAAERTKIRDISCTYPYNIFVWAKENGYASRKLPDGTPISEIDLSPALLKKAFAEILTEKEEAVLECRFGYNLTLQETSTRFDLTRERVRQIEKEALAKLFSPKNARKFVCSSLDELEKAKARIESLEKEIARLRSQNGTSSDEADISDDQTPIEELELDARSYNALTKAGCKTKGDLIKIIENEDIMRIRGFGKGSLQVVRRAVGLPVPKNF